MVIAAASLAVCFAANSFAFGKSKLSAKVIELDGQSVSAVGNASLTMTSSGVSLKLGQVRLESMTAQSINVDLKKDKNKKLAMKSASATGGVVIRAKRADKDTGPDGKPIIVIHDVHASAKSAVMAEGQDYVKLTGDVLVKITEPGVAEPVAEITGEIVTISLTGGKIRIEGQGDKQADVTVSPPQKESK